MRSKLDEIKQALEEYEVANEAYHQQTDKEVEDLATEDRLRDLRDLAERKITDHAVYYLRALVDVADAAAALAKAVAHDESSDALWKWQANIFEALKALE